jgi:uncharacterized membrane protein YkoI
MAGTVFHLGFMFVRLSRVQSAIRKQSSRKNADSNLKGIFTMRALTVLLAVAVLVGSTNAQEKKGDGLKLKDLPAAVQKTVQDNLKGGEIKNISKEKEDGVEQYEIESVMNGNARDFNVDARGKLLVVEEATTINAIPAAARASILKKVADGKLNGVETFAKTGQPTMYEASYTDKKSKKHEVLVKADGSETKE